MRIMMCDTETTGLHRPSPPATGIVQVAALDLDENLNVVKEFNSLVAPGCAIAAEATKIHGITEDMVAFAMPLEDVFRVEEPVLFIAHNVKFDYPRLAPQLANCVGKLCTLETARRFVKGQPNNKLVTLVEYLGLKQFKAHDALGDCYMAVELLRYLVDITKMNVVQLAEHMATTTKIPTEINFGKHAGKKLSELPLPYINWLLDLSDLNAGLRRGLEMQRNIRGMK